MERGGGAPRPRRRGRRAPASRAGVGSCLGTGSAQGAGSATSSGALSALVSTIIVDSWFVGVAWWHSLRRFALSATSWGFQRLERRSLLLVPVGLALSYIALVVSMSVYSRLFGPPPEQNIIKDFPHTGSGIALFALTAIVVAPVFEETLFRGFLFQGFSRSWGPVFGSARLGEPLRSRAPAAFGLRAALRAGPRPGLGLLSQRVAVDEHRRSCFLQRDQRPGLGGVRRRPPLPATDGLGRQRPGSALEQRSP